MARHPVIDEFTHLPISRQRRWQLRMQRDKRCQVCGAPMSTDGNRCLQHLVSAREYQRKTRGLKKRYRNSLSYRLEAAEEKTPS